MPTDDRIMFVAGKGRLEVLDQVNIKHSISQCGGGGRADHKVGGGGGADH